jgi:hypothetical protein
MLPLDPGVDMPAGSLFELENKDILADECPRLSRIVTKESLPCRDIPESLPGVLMCMSRCMYDSLAGESGTEGGHDDPPSDDSAGSSVASWNTSLSSSVSDVRGC